MTRPGFVVNIAERGNPHSTPVVPQFRLVRNRAYSRAKLGAKRTCSILPSWGYRGGSPTAVRPSDPALCGSCPLVTPPYCILGDLLCNFVYIVLCVHYCLCIYLYLVVFVVFFVFCSFLQYFDTVGWVIWPVKTVSRITYTVLVGT